MTRYSAKTHGYSFQTDLPMLLVKLKQSKEDGASLLERGLRVLQAVSREHAHDALRARRPVG